MIRTEERGDDGIVHVHKNAYDYKDNKIREENFLGATTTFEYDAFGHVVRTSLPENGVLLAAYDAAGRKIATADAAGHTTGARYNAYGNPIEILHPDGTSTRSLYYCDGALHKTIDAEGTTTTHFYDFLGREIRKQICDKDGTLLSEESNTYDAFHLLSKRDPAGNLTTYFYDKTGRKIAEETELNRTEYSYDTLGRLNTIRQEDLVTITERDLLDRIIEERKETSKQQLLSYTNYTYDAAGNLTATTASIAGTEQTEHSLFDSFHRLIEKTNALNHSTHITYDEHYHLRKIETDPLNNQTIEIFDTLGRVSSQEKVNAAGQRLSFEEFFYDPNGNLTCQRSTLDHTIETQWEYDAMNRLIRLTEAANTPEEKTTTYTYTPRGLSEHTVKPDGVILTYTYDALARPTTLTSSDGTIAYTFHYNTLNQLIAVDDHLAQTSAFHSYDARGHLLQETLLTGITLTHTYDRLGRRTSLTLPDRSAIHYTYDPLFLRRVDRISSSSTILYSHYYTQFDLSGHLLEESLIDNSLRHFTIDPLGRTQALATPFGTQEVLEYDPIGLIRKMSWNTPEGYDESQYDYDDLYQLISESGLFSHSYTFDAHFNRRSKDDSPYTLNDLNQLLSTDTTHWTYDQNGNPLSKTTADTETHYTYDALDRLITVTQNETFRLQFTYDSLHRRLSKTLYLWKNSHWEMEKRLHFLYDGLNEIGAIDFFGTITELRILGSTPQAEIGAAIALELGGKTYIPLHDLQGNLSALLSLDGIPLESYRYSAFGEELLYDAHIPNPWHFSSKRLDEETGLVYYGRRYYAPDTGRWLTPDPQGFTDSLNLYAFVHNDPLIHLDLYGLEAIPPQRNWFLETLRTSYDWTLKGAQFVGRIMYHTFYNAMPIPGIRHAGLQLSRLLGFRAPRSHPSQVVTIGQSTTPRATHIVLNGQDTKLSTATARTTSLSDTLGGDQVNLIYDSTRGFLRDTLESLAATLFNYRSSAVKQGTDFVKQRLQEQDTGPIIFYPHSQGGLTAKLILKSIRKDLSPEQRQRIVVRSFGSASLFKFRHMDIQHYAASDIVTWVDLPTRLKASFSSNSNVVRLKRQPGTIPLMDHSWDGPAYSRARKQIIDEIKEMVAGCQ